jgi:hypothetical protein
MLTQRERIDALRRKLKKHGYFLDGDCKLNREEAALVLNILDKAQAKSDRQHEHYMANQEHYQQLGRERYAKKKDEINEKRRQARYLKEVEDAFK